MTFARDYIAPPTIISSAFAAFTISAMIFKNEILLMRIVYELNSHCQELMQPRSDLNREPPDPNSGALPLSYEAIWVNDENRTRDGRATTSCLNLLAMSTIFGKRGFEPRIDAPRAPVLPLHYFPLRKAEGTIPTRFPETRFSRPVAGHPGCFTFHHLPPAK